MKTYVEDVSELHPDDLKSFRDQERQRYENPLKPFRFKFQKYEFVVGPVKGIFILFGGCIEGNFRKNEIVLIYFRL